MLPRPVGVERADVEFRPLTVFVGPGLLSWIAGYAGRRCRSFPRDSSRASRAAASISQGMSESR